MSPLKQTLPRQGQPWPWPQAASLPPAPTNFSQPRSVALLGLAKPPPVAWLLNCMAATRPAHGPSMLIYNDLYTMGIHGIFGRMSPEMSRITSEIQGNLQLHWNRLKPPAWLKLGDAAAVSGMFWLEVLEYNASDARGQKVIQVRGPVQMCQRYPGCDVNLLMVTPKKIEK
jgi:hypothetical protein